MALPSLSLTKPTDLAALEFTLAAFEIIYTDATDQMTASLIKIEADTVNTFNSANLKSSSFTTVLHNSTIFAAFNLANGTWYWRVIATNPTGTTTSPIRSLTVTQVIKKALAFYENITKLDVWANKRALAFYENIAKLAEWPNKRAVSFYENVSKLDVWTNKRALYDYENIVIDPPVPFIDRLSTTRSAPGALVTITGNGFGYAEGNDPTNEDRFLRSYNGEVWLGAYRCGVISWSWQSIVVSLPAEVESGALFVRLKSPTVRDSNLIGYLIEMPGGETIGHTGLELFLCSPTNPNQITARLEGASDCSFQKVLNNCGSGSMELTAWDPKAKLVTDLSYILCRLDGVDRFKWVVEKLSPTRLSSSGDRVIKASGRGLLSVLDWATVYPSGYPHPVSLERLFENAHGGAILRTLILEAQHRGCVPDLTVTWTADADSMGVPFDDNTTVSFHAGETVLTALEKLTDGLGLFDIDITPSMRLNLYTRKNPDLSETVIYRTGQALVGYETNRNSGNLVNAILVEGQDNTVVESTHPTSPYTYGRREGYLRARDATDQWAQLLDYGQLTLVKTGEVEWGVQADIINWTDSNGNRMDPFIAYDVGDTIGVYLPLDSAGDEIKQALRVRAVTVTADDDTKAIKYTADLNTLVLENEISRNQQLERSAMNTINSPLESQGSQQALSLDVLNAKFAALTHGTLAGLDADDHTQYLTALRHASADHSAWTKDSAYETAQAGGYLGSETDFETDLANVATSAYETAKDGGYAGTLSDFETDLASIEDLATTIAAIVGGT